ncbi:molybdenum cofactor guanylyltransferase [Gudongella sp. SC589]|jgi:molybdopterin-guanine dinucleotide biosynthesis protein A|uniref:molybdenum cofactor guanylyltransferase n=1 Tax=Gudongella sp. SC589 TaxID=3385990 RepID=UPI003904AAF7
MKKFGSAIILAGGKSTRMGFDKQLIRFQERSLVETLIQKLREEFQEIVIVTNKPEYYIGLADIITGDVIEGKGPLGGIHAGLLMASSRYSYVVACDMPSIDLEYVRYMKNRIANSNPLACVTRLGEWIEPFNAFYRKDLSGHIERFLTSGGRAIHRMLDEHSVEYVPEKEARRFSPDWNMFYNLNTREDVQEYLQRNEGNGA